MKLLNDALDSGFLKEKYMQLNLYYESLILTCSLSKKRDKHLCLEHNSFNANGTYHL